jgi:hypothetical protein
LFTFLYLVNCTFFFSPSKTISEQISILDLLAFNIPYYAQWQEFYTHTHTHALIHTHSHTLTLSHSHTLSLSHIHRASSVPIRTVGVHKEMAYSVLFGWEGGSILRAVPAQ